MGSAVKVASKRADEPYVHELCLVAEDLEQRYRNQEVGGRAVWAAQGCLRRHARARPTGGWRTSTMARHWRAAC